MSSMSQCFNIVYLAGGFTHALNDVLHGAERERLGVPVFKLAKDHWYPAPRKLRQDFLGVGVKLYAICFQRMINNCACLVVFDSYSWFWSASIPCQLDMAFFLDHPPTTEIYTHSLHDALPPALALGGEA